MQQYSRYKRSMLFSLTWQFFSQCPCISGFSSALNGSPGMLCPLLPPCCRRKKGIYIYIYMFSHTHTHRFALCWYPPRCVEHECGPVSFHRSCDNSIKKNLLQQHLITFWEKQKGKMYIQGIAGSRKCSGTMISCLFAALSVSSYIPCLVLCLWGIAPRPAADSASDVLGQCLSHSRSCMHIQTFENLHRHLTNFRQVFTNKNVIISHVNGRQNRPFVGYCQVRTQ